jgi:hypothetical protein
MVSVPDGPAAVVVLDVVDDELLLHAAASRPTASAATSVFGGLMFSPFTNEYCARRGLAGPPGATAGMMGTVGGPTALLWHEF